MNRIVISPVIATLKAGESGQYLVRLNKGAGGTITWTSSDTTVAVVDANGNTVIDPAGGFSYVAGGLPLWKWLLSPVLVMGAEGGGMIIAILAFLLVVGGVFNALEVCSLMKYMLDRLVHRFGAVRYRLLGVVCRFNASKA